MTLASIRTTTAHILACAVCDLFPETQLIAVQTTQEGFFCDFDTRQPIDEQALPLIEEKMRGLTKSNIAIEKREMMRENAAELFRHRGLSFQVEQALAAESPTVFVLHIGKFCAYLSHDREVGELGSFKILSVRRDKRYLPERGEIPVLRIHGTACEDLPALKQWLKTLKAAKKQDHRVVGAQLQLFRETSALFPGSWSFLPRGVELCEALLDFWRIEVQRAGFQLLKTPPLQTNGVTLTFEGKTYSVLSDRTSAHCHIFKESGATLPVKFAECSEQFFPLPLEQTEGLLRSRLQLIDSLHLFCSPQQALAACISSLQFFDRSIKLFSFEPHWELIDSRPAGSPVRQAEWRPAVALLTQAIEGTGIRAEGSSQTAEMRGPRLQMVLRDSLGRKWAVAYLEVDLFHPAKLSMRSLVLLTGSLFGSVERFIALLIENGIDLNRVLRRVKRIES